MRNNSPNPTLGLGCLVRQVVNISLGILVAWLSVPVVINLLSSRQVMNTSFNPLRIVNTYGAFGRYGRASWLGSGLHPGVHPDALLGSMNPRQHPLHLGGGRDRGFTGCLHLPQYHQRAD